jgi:hypothetical protein
MAAERREHMKASINPLEEQITDIWAPQVQVNKLNTVHYSPPSYRNREKNEGFPLRGLGQEANDFFERCDGSCVIPESIKQP